MHSPIAVSRAGTYKVTFIKSLYYYGYTIGIHYYEYYTNVCIFESYVK